MDGAPASPDLDYLVLMRAALVGVVRAVLARVADEGLPGDHHFYLTFGTGEAGVEVPAPLRKQFPEEMTIVLQHQFWNLAVDDAGFAVTLRFDGRPERLVVPWPALRSFVDPSVEFGFRLQPAPREEPAGASPRAAGARPARPRRAANTTASPPAAPPAGPSEVESGPGKVVDIGPFRRGPAAGRSR